MDARSGELLAWLEHADAVDAASFSSDGKLIVTASADGITRVWDAASGKLLATSPVTREKCVPHRSASTARVSSRQVLTAPRECGTCISNPDPTACLPK
jgi:WD40 repeat protein